MFFYCSEGVLCFCFIAVKGFDVFFIAVKGFFLLQ